MDVRPICWLSFVLTSSVVFHPFVSFISVTFFKAEWDWTLNGDVPQPAGLFFSSSLTHCYLPLISECWMSCFPSVQKKWKGGGRSSAFTEGGILLQGNMLRSLLRAVTLFLSFCSIPKPNRFVCKSDNCLQVQLPDFRILDRTYADWE